MSVEIDPADYWTHIASITAPRTAMMEHAARLVMALGYEPHECLLRSVRGHGGMGTDVEIDRLEVLGEPCFEVRVEMSPWVDHKRTYKTIPRVIAWPPFRSTPSAPQVQRQTMVGSP